MNSVSIQSNNLNFLRTAERKEDWLLIHPVRPVSYHSQLNPISSLGMLCSTVASGARAADSSLAERQPTNFGPVESPYCDYLLVYN